LTGSPAQPFLVAGEKSNYSKGCVTVNKKSVPLALTLLLLVALTCSTAAAQAEAKEVLITVWSNGSHTVAPGQVAVVRAGWGACTPGLVNVFIKASNFELELNDAPFLSPDQVDELWGSIEPCPTCAAVCLGNTEPKAASWRYVLTDLAPGEYVLHSRVWIDHKLTDGSDYDGDGTPDFFYPDTYYFDTENTIKVLEE
jgi:hypothetical protein